MSGKRKEFFRTYKRTMKKVKLMSRTVRLLHREAEASMIATQLLLCQGALAMPAAKEETSPVLCSPRRVLLEIRKESRVPSTNASSVRRKDRPGDTRTSCSHHAERKTRMAAPQAPSAA